MNLNEQVDAFRAGRRFAVVGASADRSKYGNKVLRVYQQNGMEVVPVNPNATIVEGLNAVATLDDLDEPVHAISIITQPHITDKVVEQALRLGIEHIWIQPGAESEHAVELATRAGVNLLANGPCILVAFGYREN